MCVVSVPHAHGFQTIPHKNYCRAVCAEMFQNLKLWSSGNILVTISFQIQTDEFCPLLTQRGNTQLWKCRYEKLCVKKKSYKVDCKELYLYRKPYKTSLQLKILLSPLVRMCLLMITTINYPVILISFWALSLNP